MRAEEDCGAALSCDTADQREHQALTGRVEPERRLVEEDDLRLVHQRACNPQPLAHAAAVARDQRGATVGQTDLGKQARGDRPRTRAALAVEPSEVAQVLVARLALRVTGTLRQDANPPADLGRPGVRDTRDRERPRVGERIVVSTRIAVVLPAPFGPSTPRISPTGTVKLRLSSATSGP